METNAHGTYLQVGDHDGTWKHWNDIIRRDLDLTAHLTVLHQYGI